jgi:hypothetical protein
MTLGRLRLSVANARGLAIIPITAPIHEQRGSCSRRSGAAHPARGEAIKAEQSNSL